MTDAPDDQFPLFRWFFDMQPADGVFDPTTFTHNRKRLDTHGRTATFFAAVVGEAVTVGLCRDRFTVNGTSIESGAALKSFRPAEGGENPKEQPRCSVPASARPGGRPPGQGQADESHWTCEFCNIYYIMNVKYGAKATQVDGT